MPSMLRFVVALAMMLAAGRASGATYEVATQPGLVYAEHDGTRLLGDFYLPKGRAAAPVLIAMHGGAWQVGDRTFYRYWGPFLARKGYALFAIEYRLGKPGAYPAAGYDVKAAIQFVRANAAKFGVDADRIGLMGDSAGGHLAALLALAGDQFATAYRDDAHAATPANVKAVVAFYGIFDMLAQWNHDVFAEQKQEIAAQKNHDLIPRRHYNITEEFLGVSPIQNPRVYFQSSPITYATADRNKLRFLLVHGSRDNLVDPQSQTGTFYSVLKQAGFFVQQLIIPGAGHYWATEPFENAPRSYGETAARQVLRFLASSL